MKEIIPSNNSTLKIIVDDEDYPLLSRWKWYISDTGYAMSCLGIRKHVRMHRLVYGTASNRKLVVDHLNRNKLDNRKANLRLTTQANNSRNRKSIGFCWDASKKSYMVRYRNKFYGRYKTAKEAERAYKLACSGVEYVPRRRQKYMLPNNLYRQAGKWGWGFSRDGVRYRKNGYATMSEAQKDLKLKLREMRITS